MKKSGLGKGIDALFQENVEKTKDVIILNLDELETNDSQPRTRFDESSLRALSDSIKENGILQPIVVKPIGAGKYQIIAGERRFRASKLANIDQIPAVIRDVDSKKSAELALIENLQREDLNPIEEARGYLNLIKTYGLTQDDVSKKVGKSRSSIANLLRLLNLPEEIADEVENGKLSEGQARALLSASDENLMKKLAKKAILNKLSVREIERQVAFSKKGAKKVSKLPQNYHIYRDLEISMKEELKRNVKIEVASGEKGRLIIDFYNREELVDMAYSLANKQRY